MRLTLRTLLAYLDDTLEPSQARSIGQKVAESEVAQELIDRIKKATRRRGLNNPPAVGAGAALDPNTVAEYLDNVLPGDQIAELEETCLNSDAHLAEIAACHQILTLVLGEPARVPPMARQRMVELNKGREAMPYRRPAAAGLAAAAAERRAERDDPHHHDETWLGLPMPARRDGWLRRLAPLAGAVVIALALGAAVWLALPPPRPTEPTGESVAVRPTTSAPEPTGSPATVPEPTRPTATPSTPVPQPTGPVPTKPVPTKPVPTKPTPIDVVPIAEIDKGRRPIGKFVSMNQVLLQRAPDQANWERVHPDAAIHSADVLVSLPGYRSQFQLASGVHLLLWGSLPELLNVPYPRNLDIPLYESEAVLHVPPKGFDLDITLLHGRVVLSNQTGRPEARARLRFDEEVWDITLRGDGAEVVVDLFHRYTDRTPFNPKGDGEKPQAEVSLGVLVGRATVHASYRPDPKRPAPAKDGIALEAPAGKPVKCWLVWDNKVSTAPEVRELKQPWDGWSRLPPTTPPFAKELALHMNEALLDLSKKLSLGNDQIDLVLATTRQEPRKPSEKPGDKAFCIRILSVFCLGAVDAPAALVDALDDPNFPEVRGASVFVLRHWIAQRPENERELLRVLIEKKGYSEREAHGILVMLHGINKDTPNYPGVYEKLVDALENPKLAIRQLAYWTLTRLDPEVARADRIYRPDADAETRQRGAAEWKKHIPESGR